MSELASGAAAALAAIAPDEDEGAADLVAAAERAVSPLEPLAPELRAAGELLRGTGFSLRELASDLRGFLDSLEAEPGRLEAIEAELERFTDLRRRYRASTTEELLARAAAARAELDAIADGHDPVRAAAEALAGGRGRDRAAARRASGGATRRRAAVRGGGRRRARRDRPRRGRVPGSSVTEAEPGPAGADAVRFLARPNAGLPFAPVAETASGGELSRIALAIAAVGGGETMVFDEIDAGIGGRTAHAVGDTLRRLASRAQVITITHLPQIASLADRHFLVEKVAGDPTHTTIEPLGADGQREELERMLGGAEFLAILARGERG